MPRGRRFEPGRSGNPTGRPKSSHEFAKLCRESSDEAFKLLREKAKKPGLAGFRALELWLAYGHGRPAQHVAITAKGGAPAAAFAGAARAMLEAAIERAESGGPVTQTVAVAESDAEKASNAGVIDVIAEPVPVDRDQPVADRSEGGTP